ncbi:MucBP domain-containing protein [Enterococcus cecorum]|uniref:MucBP domain-containing protein n=1 Tax=Enterococcus cecorum TaxID=44008 RepID=UPI0032C3FA9A
MRKKRGGGGAASFIIGSVLFGALMMAPATLAAETGTTSLQPSIGEIISRASGATADQLATNKVSVSNVRFDRTDIKESRGLDITYSYDWTAKNLKQGDMLVSDMPDAFTSITKEVGTPFYSNNQELGKLVLDYNNKKIYTYFTGDIDPNKIYNGTINIATFVNRDHFKEVENHEDVQLNLPDGKTATLPLNVTFDAAVYNPELQLVSVYAKEATDNPDGSMNVKWATTINKVANQDVDEYGKPVTLNDAIVYLSPDTAEGVDVVFPGGDEESAYSSIKPKYKDNALYKIDKNSIEVFEANIYDSMGYQTTKKLVKGVDYQIIEPSTNLNAYVVEFIGNYASTDKQFVITYGGKVEGESRNNPTINTAVSDSLIAFYEGRNLYAGKYSGKFQSFWAEANIDVNNSSVTASMQDATGSVTVVHVDASTGKVLKAEDYAKTKDGQEAHDVTQGTEYTTAPEKFEGYKFTTLSYDSAPAQGTVKQQLQRVVYLYVPEDKKGSVDVVHKTTDGQILEAVKPVATDENVGTSYSTEKGTFEGYHFVGMAEESAAADGVVTEGTKHVIYLYEKDVVPEVKKGNVDVTYIAEYGTVLEAKSDVVKDGEIGSNYETTQKEFAGYHFTRMGQFSAEATGQVEEGTKHVVYVYAKDPEEKKGNVDVTYVTEDGRVLEATSDVVKNGEIGSNYETTQKEFAGYHFTRMGQFSAEATGQVEEGTKHVVYVYAKNPETPVEKKGSVDVKYITKDGKVLEDVTSVKDNAPVGEDYTTEEKAFDGYHFVGMDKSSDAATGVVAEGTKHVIYVYEKDVTPGVKKGNVDVTYVTEDGRVLEATSEVVKDGEIGSNYETTQKEFAGYHFIRMGQFSAEATGQVEEGAKHVVYVYAKNPETPVEKKGSVDVKYITTTGEVLEDVTSVKDNAPVGEDYTTEEKAYDGYHFVGMDKSSDAATGLVAEVTKHVIYVYEKDVEPEEKKGSVDVKYITKDGKVLEDVTSVKDNAPVGEDYTTEEKAFDGYHFVGMSKDSDPATGVVSEGSKHVVYVYEKVKTTVVEKGSVDVVYVTSDGKVLEKTSTVKENVPVGEIYETTEKTFDGYHFVGMDKTSEPTSGVVTKGTKHVIYVYEKDPEKETPVEKKGTVTVVYVDQDGNPLPGGEKLTIKENVPVGEDYATEQKKFDGYHFVGMGKNSSPVSGKVTEGTKEVIYVYEKDKTPTPKTPRLPRTGRPQQGTPTQEQVVSQTSVATSTVKRHLPKTGTTNQSSNTVLGLASLSFAGLLGLIIKRRRGENEKTFSFPY